MNYLIFQITVSSWLSRITLLTEPHRGVSNRISRALESGICCIFSGRRGFEVRRVTGTGLEGAGRMGGLYRTIIHTPRRERSQIDIPDSHSPRPAYRHPQDYLPAKRPNPAPMRDAVFADDMLGKQNIPCHGEAAP